MSDHIIRWGVLGPGRIAHRFAQSLAGVPGARLVAAASRDRARAEAFVATHGAERAHASYEALCGDDGVDAIYIGTTHNFHEAQALMAIGAGKAVLCEKPLTVNAAQAQRVFDAAQRQQVFVMEALWTRFLPVYAQLRRWLAEERIGPVTGIEAYFGFDRPRQLQDRLFRLELAGGSLLDAGVYGLSISQWLFGGPLQLQMASAALGVTGVDEDLRAKLLLGSEPAGIELRLHTSLRYKLYNGYLVKGTRGSILVTEAFWAATQAVLQVDGQAPETAFAPFDVNGFEYQVREVHRCLAQGALQSEVMPWADTLAVMRCMDEIRAAVAVRYPWDEGAAADGSEPDDDA